MSADTMSGAAWWELYAAAGMPDLDARSVECRTCGARVGVYCRRPSGHKAWDAHALRWDDAVRALSPRADTCAGTTPTPNPEPEGREKPIQGQSALF